MRSKIRGDKVDITEAIKVYVEDKLSRLDRYFEKVEEIEASVVIRIRNLEQIIEVTIPTDKWTLRAEETHTDLYAAIDLVVDKLERQIRKNKTRLIDNRRRKNIPDMGDVFKLDFDDDDDTSKIVKRKNVDSKPMSEEEAILQMSLLNHDFFIFKNVDEDCYSVLYLRKDGQYGIINAK